MINNTNRIALISGGLGDIGSAIAVLFLQQGMQVAISDLLDEKEAMQQVKEMNKAGEDLWYKQVDITSEKEVVEWIDAVEKKWGVPQVIVPNAGIVVAGSLTGNEFTSELARKQIEVNFWGTYHLAVLSAKKIKSKGVPGRITMIGSWAAERPHARISSYCISKAAVRMLCKTLALELANDDILVNEIAPGIVKGGLSKKNQDKDPQLLQTHLNSIPTHKLITVEEVAKHVLHLSAFENMSITGSRILIDGGLSLTSKMTR